MGHWPGDICRCEHDSRTFYVPKYLRQSTNSIKINCHRKLKCLTPITWPLLIGYWMTTIAVVISLMRKLHLHLHFYCRTSFAYLSEINLLFAAQQMIVNLSVLFRTQVGGGEVSRRYTYTRAIVSALR